MHWIRTRRSYFLSQRSFLCGTSLLSTSTAVLFAVSSQIPTFAQEATAQEATAQEATAQEATAQEATAAVPATIVVSPKVAGITPTGIGYVMGEDLPGSNVTSWLRYSGMNIARQWWPAESWPLKPARPKANWALSDFETQRILLRKDPEKQIDWKNYDANVANPQVKLPDDNIGQSFVLSELRKIGVAPLIVLSHTPSQYPFDDAAGNPDWFGRWTYWRGIYANAFYLAYTYNVERFQLFNEPDGREQKELQQPDFIRRLQLGSDAIQAALLDVNRIYGKNLTPRISAPVSAGMNVFQPRTGREDTRDLQTGWGELAMRSRLTDFPGKGDYNQGAFQDYAFQNYQKNPEAISTRLPQLMDLIAGANGGKPLPVIASEMNVSTAADFSKTDATLDTPRFYAAFGAIAAAYANAGMSEIYVFRLTQSNNFSNGTVKKNGTYIIDNNDPLKNIVSSTKGAEAARLFMHGFNGGKTRFAPATASPDLYTLSARDESTGNYTLMVTNLGASKTVSLDLSPWKLPAGTPVFTEEVSEAHHGDISNFVPLPDSSKMSLPMSENSIDILTIRSGLSPIPEAVRVMKTTLSPGETSSQKLVGGVLLSQKPGQVVLLSLKLKLQSPTSAATPMRFRVYGGSGDVSSAQLLGQLTVGEKSSEEFVDATSYATVAEGTGLVFQIVPDALKSPGQNVLVEDAKLQVFKSKAGVVAK